MIEREIMIEAPQERVFEVIRNIEAYPEFLSGTENAVERSVSSGFEGVFTINLIKKISYTLKFKEVPPRELSWELKEGELMKKNSGSWTLTSLSPTQTKAVYRLDISFGWLVPKTIVAQLTELQLPQMLEAFKLRAENKLT